MKTRHPAGELGGGCPLIANDYPIMTQGATPSKQQLHPAPCLTLHLIGGSGAPVVPNHYLPLYKGAGGGGHCSFPVALVTVNNRRRTNPSVPSCQT